MANVGNVNTDVRALMSDEDNAVFSDAVLLPFIQKSYRKVQRKLAARGVSVFQDTTVLSPAVPINTTALTTSSSPALPADLIVPYIMWERQSGGADTDWLEMDAKDVLPVRAQGELLAEWVYEANAITLVGATVTREVKIKYERELTALSGNGSVLLIPFSQDAVASYAAEYAARSRTQPELATEFRKLGDMELDELANTFVRSKQAITGRRRLGYGRTA